MALLQRSLIARSPGHQPGATGCNATWGLALASPRWCDAEGTLPGTMAAMSSESSFDIVNKPDHQEIDNAVSQTAREITKRFDFKGVDAGIRWSGETIEIQANSDLRANAVLDLFKERLV